MKLRCSRRYPVIPGSRAASRFSSARPPGFRRIKRKTGNDNAAQLGSGRFALFFFLFTGFDFDLLGERRFLHWRDNFQNAVVEFSREFLCVDTFWKHDRSLDGLVGELLIQIIGVLLFLGLFVLAFDGEVIPMLVELYLLGIDAG